MDELGQKKSGTGKIVIAVLIALLAIGAYMMTSKKSSDTPSETTPAPVETTTAPTEGDGTGVLTDTKKLAIDRPTSATADIPTSYVSTDPAVVEMMKARTLGSDSAPVKIIEYASLTCGHCGAFHRDTLPEFKTKFIDTGRAQIIYKEFPLNEPAVNASMILRCMPADKYHEFMKTLFDTQDKWAYDPKYMDLLRQTAKTAGMDDASFDTCLANTELKKSLIGDMKAGSEKFKIQSTPSFVFNNGERVLVGNQPMNIFEDTITKAEKGELSAVSSNLSVTPTHAGHAPEATAPAAAPAPAPTASPLAVKPSAEATTETSTPQE
jgi:protein-disulfide isomerase